MICDGILDNLQQSLSSFVDDTVDLELVEELNYIRKEGSQFKPRKEPSRGEPRKAWGGVPMSPAKRLKVRGMRV